MVTVISRHGLDELAVELSCAFLSTLRLAPLVVHVQCGSPVYPRDHLEVGAVEAVHSDHTGLGVEVAFV